MNTIFKLTEIATNSKEQYPFRTDGERVVGYYDTLSLAVQQMKATIEERQDDEIERLKWLDEDPEYRKQEERDGHDVFLAYYVTELEINEQEPDNILSVRSYTADGQPNDQCLLDHKCESHFEGRTPDQIRFKRGDIVEVMRWWGRAQLCVVWNTPPSVEWYADYRARTAKKYADSDYLPHLDYSDDSYLVFTLEKEYVHFHPNSTDVFRPTQEVPPASIVRSLNIMEQEMRKERQFHRLRSVKEAFGTDKTKWLTRLVESGDKVPFAEDTLIDFRRASTKIRRTSYGFGKGHYALQDCLCTLSARDKGLLKIWTSPHKSLTMEQFDQVVGDLVHTTTEVSFAIGTASDLQEDEIKMLWVELEE